MSNIKQSCAEQMGLQLDTGNHAHAPYIKSILPVMSHTSAAQAPESIVSLAASGVWC